MELRVVFIFILKESAKFHIVPCTIVFVFNMVSLITIFGLLGNITTGLVYLAPANTFWYIVRRRSTEEFDCLPYVVKLLNGYMWVYYGVVKPDSILVATINGFGSVLELIYVTIFIIFAPPRMRAITAMLFVVFPIGAVLVTQMSCNREMQINVSGFLSLLFCVATYGSLYHENCGDNKERGVHAFPPLFDPLHQWTCMDCLCSAH
ncbi:bidirectional sugar transporter SWEET17-like [Hibiscus syriacus]|uniref:bidirectional sugar transporter SWEET17-like n=1 Tax=Hibiscus syriacus TaxID=106335 RepID=UPI00192216C2|nr:bidirectional sugar transporter SWEET17-like [Hibiscus syriacus]